MSYSQTTIMTVGELIDSAFGEPDANIVHHKHIQAILYLLARQLRVLQRRVNVHIGSDVEPFNSTLSVTEIKLHALQKKKRKTNKSSDSDRSAKEKDSKKGSGKSPPQTQKSGKANFEKDLQDNADVFDEYEMQRERELRIIHQRADSKEEHDEQPTIMKSLDSIEINHETLLVVERVPIKEAKARAERERSGARSTRSESSLAIVTQEQFLELVNKVQQLQKKLGLDGGQELPEKMQLMLELRKGASLTDAMAALQLSARLEVAEKMIERLLSLITELTARSGVAVDVDKDMQVIYKGAKEKSAVDETKSVSTLKGTVAKDTVKKDAKSMSTSPRIRKSTATNKIDEPDTEDEEKVLDSVTYEELDAALAEMYKTIIKTISDETERNTTNADNALKTARRLEVKLEASMNLADKMKELEAAAASYAERINILDTGLSSQMTNYQEELTQMQHDLETGLENMAEVLANTGGDATAVAELNTRFNEFQYAIDNSMIKQKELKQSQANLSVDLDAIRAQIEVLRATKADRDEVDDALRDKVGLGALNGMVSLQQFDAVRGDYEQRIGAAYHKFNSQELVWQKVIDDLLRELNEKADYVQVAYLRDDINQNLNNLNNKLNFMMEIVGEPSAAALARRIHRDSACLSCSAPAHMLLEEGGTVQKLPALRPPAIGAEEHLPQDDGDHKKCYPGNPIPHPSDPRSHACNRWCGGSHTMLPKTVSRVPPGMTITCPQRNLTMDLGTDGRMYAVDVPDQRKPCSQCNVTKAQQDNIESVREHSNVEDGISGMTLADYRPTFATLVSESAITPSPMFD